MYDYAIFLKDGGPKTPIITKVGNCIFLNSIVRVKTMTFSLL